VSGQKDIETLIGRCAQGHRGAFSTLYRLTAAKLYGIIRRILQQSAAAEEALQETYVRIWQNAASYDARTASPIAWMAAIARNQAIDLKRRGSEKISEAAISDDQLLSSLPAEPDPIVKGSLMWSRLQRCLEELPLEKRKLVVLAYCQGFSREELARSEGKPVATIKSTLRRSLLALKECLDGK
jgi:RNA polymerase sigma-70 factor (ECF subfamily)